MSATGRDLHRTVAAARRYVAASNDNELGRVVFGCFVLIQKSLATLQNIPVTRLDAVPDDLVFSSDAATLIGGFQGFLLGLDSVFFRDLVELDLTRPLEELAEAVTAGHESAMSTESR